MISLLLCVFVAFAAVCVAKHDPTTDGYNVTQIHLAQGATPESMSVVWVTANPAQSVVRYGLEASVLDMSAVGTSSSYNFDYPQYGVYESGVIHTVYLKNLKPGTTYYYRCGDFDADATSGELSFTTMPNVGDLDTFYVGVIGDLGQTNDSITTMNHMLENRKLSMILHAGDLSYADCNQPLWDSYGEMIQVLAAERPWMVGPGNHELELTNDGGMYVAFEERYKMPAIKPAVYGPVTIPAGKDSSGNVYCASSIFQSEYNFGNSFYSFDAAGMHVIYLNPYSTTNSTSTQYQWLEADLQSVDRSVTPWVIVVMHCPWYSSNIAHYGEPQTVQMRNSMEPLFYKNHVNFVITGHVHAYERTYPLYQNQTVPDGVVYVTIGDGGNREGHASSYYPQPDWSAYRNGTQYGHGSIKFVDKNQMVWKWFRNVDGEVIYKDEFTMCNSYFGNVNC